jgi:glycosyltransferase involved in cell wall biosynthesis
MGHLGEFPDHDAAAAARPPPTVSVIIPAYNAAWCIGRTLASLQAQALADFECVIVDDGSTDETAACVEAGAAGDPRFVLIRQDNAGVAAARNRGLREARGRYVANLDADDIWRPQFLSRVVDGLEHAGPGATIGFARSVWIGPDDAVLGRAPEPLMQVSYRDLLLHNPIGNGSAALMRRDAVLACGGWDAELVRDYGPGEDWLLQLQLAARGRVVVVDEPLVLYRISLASASWDLERSGRAAAEVIRRCQASAPRLPLSDYWTARSLAMLWLLRRARQGGQLRLVIWMAVQIYLLNPAWLGEPGLREPIVTAPRKAARRLRRWIRSRTAPEARASLQEVGLDQVGDGAAPPA